jgi:hypothetical protein
VKEWDRESEWDKLLFIKRKNDENWVGELSLSNFEWGMPCVRGERKERTNNDNNDDDNNITPPIYTKNGSIGMVYIYY